MTLGLFLHQGRHIPEASPVGSSGSNGFIELGIQAVEGQGRTMKLAFESRIGEQITCDRSVIPWIIEYAAVLLNRCQVGEDGKTSYERLKCKAAYRYQVLSSVSESFVETASLPRPEMQVRFSLEGMNLP